MTFATNMVLKWDAFQSTFSRAAKARTLFRHRHGLNLLSMFSSRRGSTLLNLICAEKHTIVIMAFRKTLRSNILL